MVTRQHFHNLPSNGRSVFAAVRMRFPREGEEVSRRIFTFHLDPEKLQKADLRHGNHLLRSNLLGKHTERSDR
jgi:hypothetical protein